MTALRLLHQIHLAHDAWGGMEKQFANLLQATAEDPRVAHYLSEDLRSVASGVAAALPHLSMPAADARRWRGVTVPNWRGMRQSRQASQARTWGIDAILSWNRFGDPRPARLASRIGAASLYWERGAAWFARSRAPDADFLEGFDRYLANSQACAAMLNYWGVTAPIEICRPGILSTRPGRVRSLMPGQPLRLGFCARLQTFKGGVLAVHTLAELRRLGVAAHLIVAGDGPDQAAMQAQAQRLGLDDASLRFLGRIAPVDEFLNGIDLLLHPALREPYGNACAEALMAGVPVAAAAVDGLPEVIDSGVDGLCVVPTLALADFAAFGGDLEGVYPRVYRPEIRRVAEPGVCDPAHLARAVLDITGDPARYRQISQAAVSGALRRFDYPAHVDRLLGQVQASVAERRQRQFGRGEPTLIADQRQTASQDRAAIAASLIAAALEGRASRRVADLGCGDGKLRNRLRQLGVACDYQGYDLLPQAADVQLLDLSRQRLPQPVDLAALLGISESLEDLPGVLGRLRADADLLVISHTLGDRPRATDELQRLGWRNHLSAAHFERLLATAGWALRDRAATADGKTLLWCCAHSVASDAP